MKQYITEDQFNKLSTKAQQRLIKWSKTCKSFQEEIEEGYYNPDILLLSIGQMIEFLDDFLPNEWEGMEIGNRPMMIQPFELCDTLWETIKEILEK